MIRITNWHCSPDAGFEHLIISLTESLQQTTLSFPVTFVSGINLYSAKIKNLNVHPFAVGGPVAVVEAACLENRRRSKMVLPCSPERWRAGHQIARARILNPESGG